MGRQITIPNHTEAMAKQLAEVVKGAQREARRYESQRIASCPPSREFPVDTLIYNEQIDAWRDAYPYRAEESFVVPAIQKFFEEL